MAVLCLLIVHLKKLHSGNFELFTIDLIIEYVYMIKQSSLIMSFYGQKNQSLHLHVCRQKKNQSMLWLFIIIIITCMAYINI